MLNLGAFYFAVAMADKQQKGNVRLLALADQYTVSHVSNSFSFKWFDILPIT